MHLLHCSPLGTSKLDDFIRQLMAEGKAGTAGKIALILPSPYLLEYARTQLRKTELSAWEFPRILSLDELAASLSGFRKISRVEQELLLEKIVVDSGFASNYPCFAGISGFSGFVSALARLFDEFKMAAVTPDEMEAVLEAMSGDNSELSERDAAIAWLFRSYQERMLEYSLEDIAGTYLLAVEVLAKSAVELPFEKILMAEFSVLSPVRLQLIAELQRRVPVEIAICYEKNRPELFSAVEPVVQALLGLNFSLQLQGGSAELNPSLAHIRGQLFAQTPSVKPTASGLKLMASPTRAKETAVVADQVKAWLVATGRQPSEVALVLKDPAEYPELIQVFTERGIPLDLTARAPLNQQALLRLLLAWLDLLMIGGGRAEVFEVVKSPYICSKLNWDPDRVEKCLLPEVIRKWEDWDGALLRQAPDGNLAGQWHSCLAELRQQASRWSRAETRSQLFACFHDWLSWLDVTATLRACRKAGTLELMELRAELAARQELLATVEQMETILGCLNSDLEPMSVADFSALLRRMTNGVTVELRDRQEGGVQVMTPGAASGMKFPMVFILGLSEGRFPAQPRESWLYGDKERRLLAELGVPLSTAGARNSMENLNFALSVAMATEQLALSTTTDGETLPSRYLDEVSRLFAELAVDSEVFGVHQLVAELPSEAKSPAELIKAVLRHQGQGLSTADLWWEVAMPIRCMLPLGLEQRIALERNRSGPYAGEVSPALIEQRRFSPSALERYATCPFAYFVTDVMKLSAWEPADEGVNALSAGAIWHELLADFMGAHRDGQLDPAATESYVEELSRVLDRLIAKREQQGRLLTGVWWRFERPRWIKELRRWLQAEFAQQAGSDLRPRLFEWEFELVLSPSAEPIELQGKIDRIDSGDGSYRVIDYKTGQLPGNRKVQQGLCLQVPIYMMAAEKLLYPEANSGEGLYTSVGHEGKDFVLPGKKSSRSELFESTEQFVALWSAGICAGLFPARPVADCPPYCVASAFCRLNGEANQEETEETPDE